MEATPSEPDDDDDDDGDVNPDTPRDAPKHIEQLTHGRAPKNRSSFPAIPARSKRDRLVQNPRSFAEMREPTAAR